MTLSIIIPCFNERATLPELLRRVEAAALPDGTQKEVVVVDDGSTDGTRDLVAALPPDRFVVVLQPSNGGKGAAVRAGIGKSTGDIVLIQDADLEYDPSEYAALIAPLLRGEADVVYGSRFLNASPRSPWSLFQIGTTIVTKATNLLYGASLTDEPTCYKVFRGGLIRSLPLRCTGFEFCPEVTAKVLRRGIRIAEVPISYTPRSIKDGKKIKFRDGFVALYTLLRERF